MFEKQSTDKNRKIREFQKLGKNLLLVPNWILMYYTIPLLVALTKFKTKSKNNDGLGNEAKEVQFIVSHSHKVLSICMHEVDGEYTIRVRVQRIGCMREKQIY